MKKSRTPIYQGTPPVYGKAAKRLARLIDNPRKATLEEKEEVFNAHKRLNLVRCDLWHIMMPFLFIKRMVSR